MNVLRDRQGIKYTLIGASMVVLLLVLSKVLDGGSQPPPSTEEISMATFDDSDAAIYTDETGVVEEVAVQFAEAYYSQEYTDSEESRRQALQQYTTGEFLDSLRLGFDHPDNSEREEEFKTNQEKQLAEVSRVMKTIVEAGWGEVNLAVDIVTTSINSISTERSFFPIVYLEEVDGAWKVVGLG